jgi:transcription termination factor NusA
MMKAPVTELQGVGKGIARALAEHGIETVGDLAKVSVDDLVTIRGVGMVRAVGLIEAATASVGGGAPKAGAPAGGDDGEKQKKKKKNKKDKDKKKKKKKKK